MIGLRPPSLAILLLAAALPAAEPPATLALADLAGQTHRLPEYRGKIVVLNFWATWCPECRHEMPMLVTLAERYGARGVQVIVASADDEDTRKNIPTFAGEMKIRFPIWVGAAIADMKRLGLGGVLPATAILDRDGRIVARIVGEVQAGEIEQRLDWLLGDRATPAPPVLVDHLDDPRPTVRR
jgi:thiol-disulfide isomerase/thioredoxin